MNSEHRSNQPLTISAVVLTLLTVVLWAGTPTAVRFSTDLVPPVSVAGLRFAVAIVFMFFWSMFHGTRLRLTWSELLKPLIGGVLLFAEPVTSPLVTGCVLTMFGILLVDRGKQAN